MKEKIPVIVNRKKSRTLARLLVERPDSQPRECYDYNRVKAWTPGRSSDKAIRGSEKVATQAYCCLDRDRRTIITPVYADWYMGRSRSASVVYCAFGVTPPLWSGMAKVLHDRDLPHPFGVGDAGGGGYHKESAALQAAMEDAGFAFDANFNGAGDYAMRAAMLAVADYLGCRLDGTF